MSLFSMLGWKLWTEKLLACSTMRSSWNGIWLANARGQLDHLLQHLRASRVKVLTESYRMENSKEAKVKGWEEDCKLPAGSCLARNHLKNCCGCTSRVADSPSVKKRSSLCLESSIWDQPNANKLRKILGSLSDHIHAYVDVSFDDAGYSGAGGELLDCDGKSIGLLQWKDWPTFVDLTKAVNQETIIQEREILALAIAVVMWGPKFKGRRNYCLHRQWSGIRSSFLKTWSNNRPCNKLSAKAFKVEEEFLFLVWLERVPSQSNPSDELSRSEVAFWRGLQRSRVFPRELWEHVANTLE